MNIWDCRALHNLAELEQVVELEIRVWGLDPRDSVPSNLLHAMATNGSLIAGAFDQGRMIGMSVTFPAHHNGRWALWSHMTATHPDYQGKKVGFALKQFQRNWALEHNFRWIGWTFDPLQRGNANFNLHILGATARIYHENFYGDMSDEINAGLPSDRVEAWWDLQSGAVKKLATGSYLRPSHTEVSDESFLLKSKAGTHPEVYRSASLHLPFYMAEIPISLAALKQSHQDLALQWRLALRETFQLAIAQGYQAVDFIEVEGRFCYVFEAAERWYLYVLQCSDNTLYTGITSNLQRRLKQHNSGRGASYTATRKPVHLLATWRFDGQGQALKAEAAFKNQTRQKKLELIEKKHAFRESPFVSPDSHTNSS